MAPPKKGPRPFDSGLKRIDSRFRQTSFHPAIAINQKNYYTEYLKRDDQAMILRQLADELVKAKAKEDEKPVDEEMDVDDDEAEGSKVIVIHLGSRNTRIGLASDTYPVTVPTVVAIRVANTDEENNAESKSTFKTYDDPDFLEKRKIIAQDFKERMRFYKRRVASNAHESVLSFNKRTVPEEIPDHNDPNRTEWTTVTPDDKLFVGDKALKIPPWSKPKFKLCWPLKYGHLNENDYKSPRQLLGDLSIIIESAIKTELKIPTRDFPLYSAMFVVPDLYDKVQVSEMLSLLFRELRFEKLAIIQESVAATFGAGISSACVVDIGAQKTSISCVDDGMCVADSRVNLSYGGDDITLAMTKLLQLSQFPYKELDLSRQFDWTLMEDIKARFATANDAEINVQLYNFIQRTPGQSARKISFKTFDEVMLAPMCYFFPDIFENESKLKARHSIFERSTDVYDGTFNDPYSEAQIGLYSQYVTGDADTQLDIDAAKPSRISSVVVEDTPGSSVAGTPGPDLAVTASAITAATGVAGIAGGNAATRAAAGPSAQALSLALLDTQTEIVAPLDQAIIESISQSSRTDQVRGKKMYENIIIVGGGASSIPAFNRLLEDRVAMWKNWSTGSVTVMATPRDMDPMLLVWKGASVYVKLKIANEMWIGSKEWDLLGTRCLQYKCLFLY
ncbi:uncharacterized protein V1516DRAFT_708637 [Lipomyces oligophaga]|uniref:uncharacterized protein n=1 Tax=Lipomyces oligophaga TaxID=45792 RepID=UPI0034CD1B2A